MTRHLATAVLLLSLTGCAVNPVLATLRPAAGTMNRARAGLPPLLGEIRVNGTVGGAMKPGQAAEWAFRFTDPVTGQPVTQFDLDHEKPMHLIVVRRDLATFAHLHPTLDSRRTRGGTFTQMVNQATTDPDNQDATRAIATPGAYLLFGEVKPKGQASRSAGMTLVAEGQETPLPLVPDKPDASGAIVTYFTRDGQPGKPGDAYQVSLSLMPMTGMLHLTVTIKQSSHLGTRHYDPVSDLQPWLGMMGHGVLIGAQGLGTQDKVFRHMHAGHGGHGEGRGGEHPGTGGKQEFVLTGTDVPGPGVYKLWGQFKHRGRILTFPFVFTL